MTAGSGAKLLLFGGLILGLTASCDHKPTTPASPSPVRQIGGTWSGAASIRSTALAAEVTFIQNGSSVTATYRLPSFRWTGTMIGTLDASGAFSGTATINAPPTPQVFGLSQGCTDTGRVRDTWAPLDPRYITLVLEFPAQCQAISFLTLGLDRTCRIVDEFNLSCS
jgi:hypothetical protein